MIVLCASKPAMAQDLNDLGIVEDGDVLWIDEEKGTQKLIRAPKVACEVCVSKAIIAQADQDSREVERLQRDLKHSMRYSAHLEQEVGALKDRPGFWEGVAIGGGAGVVVSLVLVILVLR